MKRERKKERVCDKKRESESVKTSKEIVKSLGNVYEGREREKRNFIRAPNSNNPSFFFGTKGRFPKC